METRRRTVVPCTGGRLARKQRPNEAARQKAARFLSQATFGPDLELIEEVAELGAVLPS